ncbi:GDP-mannose 4,6-dehydratase [Fundidesulfovibrio putealis]|uniref:GDP-mannose 4,6-dehydratase n=1 Tax=Fundidesulfovibrio putealis TaxID=270496 RepID=UPI0004827E39|nr:GDP-mannose 4,6-dehydratase [Fundidesulfovibrio putealis]
MKRALIVGCRGQDGVLLREFLARRGYLVTGLARQAEERPDGTLGSPTSVLDPSAMAALVERVVPHEVYYLAALHHSSQQAPNTSQQSLWTASMDVNATGPVHVMEALRQHTPEARFFYAGSCLAFGSPHESPQTERTCLRPDCVYGISKAAGNHAVRLYRETHGLFAVTGILFNHESHLRPEHFLSRKIMHAVWRIKRGQEHELTLGDLSAQTDWGYAPDFVEAFWLSLQATIPDDYVIATGTPHRVQDWVEGAFSLAGLAWQDYVREDQQLLRRRRGRLVGDISRIRERCGWSPTTPFGRMLEILFKYEGRHH